jgi:hypothetical protein
MAYSSNLGGDRVLYLENRGEQTCITLATRSANQQQSQSHSLATGRWRVPPTLYRLPQGFIVRLEGESGQSFVQIQAQGIISSTVAPDWTQAEVISMSHVEDAPPLPSMPSMPPMQPLKLGNMSMSMQPMEMRMGNMSLSMNDPQPSSQSRRFCTQCGKPIQASDRFCGYCGTAVNPEPEK